MSKSQFCEEFYLIITGPKIVWPAHKKSKKEKKNTPNYDIPIHICNTLQKIVIYLKL